MDRHHAHRVGVGLGQHRLGDARDLLTLQRRPGQVGAQAAVRDLRPRPGLVDDEPQPAPRIPRTRAGGGRDLEHAAVGDDRGEHLARGQPAGVEVQLAEVGQRGADRAGGQRVGLVEPRVDGERSAAVLPPPQVVVAAAEQRRAQRGDQRQAVAGIGDRPGTGQQAAHLGGLVDQRACLGAVRDSRGVQRVLEERQRRARGHQHGDVVESRRPPCVRPRIEHLPALVERLADRGGDVGGLALAQDRRGRARQVLVRLGAEHRDRRADADVSRGRSRAGRTPAGRRRPAGSARRTRR